MARLSSCCDMMTLLGYSFFGVIIGAKHPSTVVGWVEGSATLHDPTSISLPTR